MNPEILKLTPAIFWKHFARISEIPRCSKNEAAILAFLKEQFQAWGLEWRQDAAGNLCARKPPTAGFEASPAVVLQGHVDMVCEQDTGRGHDFSCEPLTLIRDGSWVRADRTTLGADNGVAVAYMLALLEDKSCRHGPLECLFTVDEETGLSGALGLDPSLVTGRILINLDSDLPGEFITGCAGGSTTSAEWNAQTDAVLEPGWKLFKVFFHGWRGGHSGVLIHEPRGNPLVSAGAFLREMVNSAASWRLFALKGGDKHNAIPREAVLGIALAPKDGEQLRSASKKILQILERELGEHAQNVQIEVLPWEGPVPTRWLTPSSSIQAASLLSALPHGVHALSQQWPGLVETSNNLAVVKLKDEVLHLVTSQRSSVASQGAELSRKIRTILEKAGASVKQADGYPAWTPAKFSRLRDLCAELWPQVAGTPASVTVIHAGLECGILGDKLPGMDMISFGPLIEEAHTPHERLGIDSVGLVWKFLTKLLEALK
ncbi:MAG: beta-Ala-His dipeptidase [Spirochaetales bacterium]|nr:beta-Ala-His dipeptidase [Spirochaetales bacterium]